MVAPDDPSRREPQLDPNPDPRLLDKNANRTAKTFSVSLYLTSPLL